MNHRTLVHLVASLIVLTPLLVEAAPPGSAGGAGTISKFRPDDSGEMEDHPFSPRYSFAFRESSGSRPFTWIVLTDLEPPMSSLLAASNRDEARRLWCLEQRAAFVAVKLDSTGAVDLFFLCPANGQVNTEMVSTIDGLDSVQVTLTANTPTTITGTIRGGEGSCPDSAGNNAYCTERSNYTFDAPVIP